MASIRSYPNGAGGTTGADLATVEPLQSSGVIWYVGNAVTGASNSNAGTERAKPLLTLAQAYSNASAGDMIDLLSWHSETSASLITLAKAGLRVVGEGVGSSRPRLTSAVAAGNLLNVTATGVLIDNIYFPASTAADQNRILINAAGCRMNSLYFECGTNNVNTVTAGNLTTHWRMTDCTFVSTAATPGVAIYVTAGTVSDFTWDNITVDGGSFGWTTYAVHFNQAVARWDATGLSLMNGSDFLAITGTTGWLNGTPVTGSSMIDWTA